MMMVIIMMMMHDDDGDDDDDDHKDGDHHELLFHLMSHNINSCESSRWIRLALSVGNAELS